MNYIEFLDYICENQNHCLIHGLAGTGKSTLVNKISKRIGERCLKLAPTGLAAYNIDGTTIDSLLICYHNAKSSTLVKLEELYDCIIIDEISMVHHFKMDEIFQIIETLNRRGKTIKLMLIGDPFQLPPVATKNMIQAYSEKQNVLLNPADFYFFESKYFQYFYHDKIDCFLLTQNYRQTENTFKTILSNIAMGSMCKYDIDFINQRIVNPFQCLAMQNTPIVVPSRSSVKYFNRLGLDRLSPPYIHSAFFEKLSIGFEDIELDCRDITEPIVYSVNAPVVFTQNHKACHWVNGTRGMIDSRGFDYNGTEILEIYTDRGQKVQCEPTIHKLQRFVFDKNTGIINNECVAIIKQFPFIIGFALTVHRCQGMTLGVMTFNPGEGCFAPGQLYVALSRVKNINNLTLHVPIRQEDIIVSGDVRSYFDTFTQRCTVIQ